MHLNKLTYIQSKYGFYVASLSGGLITDKEYSDSIGIIRRMLSEEKQKDLEQYSTPYSLEDLYQLSFEIDSREISQQRFFRPERDFYLSRDMKAFLVAASYIIQSQQTVSRRDIEIFTEFIKYYDPNIDVLIDYYKLGYKKGDLDCLRKLFWIYKQIKDETGGGLKELLNYGEDIFHLSMIKDEVLTNLENEKELFVYGKELYEFDRSQYQKVYSLVHQLRVLSSLDKNGCYYDYLNFELKLYSECKLLEVNLDLNRLYLEESHTGSRNFVGSNNMYYIAKAFASNINREPDYDKSVYLLELCADVNPSSIKKCGSLLAEIVLNKNDIDAAEYYLNKVNMFTTHHCFYPEANIDKDIEDNREFNEGKELINVAKFIKSTYGFSCKIFDIKNIQKSLEKNISEKDYQNLVKGKINRELMVKLRHPTIRMQILGE